MSKKLGMFLGAAGVILVPVVTILIVMQARTPGSPPAGAIGEDGYQITASGLKILDEKIGDGDEAKEGKSAQVHYTGKLMEGKQFDSSASREPFKFRIGSGEVIKGWDEGVVGMKVGGKRKLIVPPNLGYGAAGKGAIPANAKLYFEIELLKVE